MTPFQKRKLEEFSEISQENCIKTIKNNTYTKYGKRYLGREKEDMRYECLVLDLEKIINNSKDFLLKALQEQEEEIMGACTEIGPHFCKHGGYIIH